MKLFTGGQYTKEDKEKLVKTLKTLDDSERDKAWDILSAMVSTAKGKKTDFSKKDLNELKKLVG